ncbi:phytoene desaturase family protein [Listeria ilorinensis]|uniref:phytoene desaturase family protein n=1 Tax=Listeria ilorinensis TaxID=2867439 RepID=UPI001EF44CBE|nr:phytoene desaturase family protein [Listeria ilorinensis]
MKNIAIVGGGITGLASAVRLAAKGHQVTMFEKEANIGGRMHQLKKDGFTFDMGPTIVMMPEIYADVFEAAGRKIDDYLDMKQLESIYDIYFSDEEKITVTTDLPQLHSTFEKMEPGSTQGFLDFLAEIYKRYTIARKYFLERTFRKPTDFYNPFTLYQGLRLKTFNSADQLIKKYIPNEKIQKLLAFQTLYIGIDPAQGPSLYSIIPMIELMYGVHYIRGGMYRMAEALEQLALELGVEIQKATSVKQILIDEAKKQAIGVETTETHFFDQVLCTADFPYAAQNLLPPLKKYPPEKIDTMDYSCSAFLLYLGVDKNLRGKVNVHNVIFSNDFEKNIQEIFSGTISEDPSLYFYAPSTIDPSLAPENKTGLYVLMPVPERKTGKFDWDDPIFLDRVKQIIFRKLKEIPELSHLEQQVISETLFTPADFERNYHAKFGAAFGLRPTLKQSNYYRPQNVSSDYKNLYFAGASTHPGAGVPIVLTSAKITTDEMLKDIEN